MILVHTITVIVYAYEVLPSRSCHGSSGALARVNLSARRDSPAGYAAIYYRRAGNIRSVPIQ